MLVLTKEGIYEELFFSDEDEEDDEVLPVSEKLLLVEQRICGVEISDLPCLDQGHNLNLTSEDMDDLRFHGIDPNDKKDPASRKIPVPSKIPLKQLEEENSWRSEGNICPRLSNNLHNINAAFKSYTCEEVTKMTKMDLF